MDETTSREKVLKKIRNALLSKPEVPYPDINVDASVYKPAQDPVEIHFAQEFNAAGGKFVYCETVEEAISNLKFLMNEKQWDSIHVADPKAKALLTQGGIPFTGGNENLLRTRVGITECEFLIARLGSIIVSSEQASGRRMNAYPEVHIVLGFTSQMVPDIKETFIKLRKKYAASMPSMVTMITGPSRTADIEKTLVMGAHGPKELYLFLFDDLT